MIINALNGLLSRNSTPLKQNKTSGQEIPAYKNNAPLMSYPAGYYLSFGSGIRLDDYKDKIAELYRQGRTQEEISNEIGCTKHGIKDALKRWGLSNKRESVLEKNKDAVIKMFRIGMKQSEIADITGCTGSSVCCALKRWNVLPAESKRRSSKIIQYTVLKTPEEIKNEAGIKYTPSSGLKMRSGSKHNFFLQDNKDLITELYQNGLDAGEIADITGFKSTSVSNALNAWGVKKPKQYILEDNKDKIIELYRQNKNADEIAEEIGCSAASAVKALRRWKIYNPRANIIEKNKDRIIKLYRRQKNCPQTAEMIGCSAAGIQSALKRWGENVKKQNVLEDNKDKIIKLSAQGRTRRDIANEFSCSLAGISKAFKRWKEQETGS